MSHTPSVQEAFSLMCQEIGREGARRIGYSPTFQLVCAGDKSIQSGTDGATVKAASPEE